MEKKPTPRELAAAVNKLVGAGAVKMGSDEHFVTKILPTGVLPVDYLLRGGLPRGRATECYGDFCLTPETKILTNDLRWIQIGDATTNDTLIGFDEQLNQGRGKSSCMWPSDIQRHRMKKLPCYRVVTDKGEITASEDHRFVWQHLTQKTRMWRETKYLHSGEKIQWVTEPWKNIHTRDAGYVAGIFDGEGWIDGCRVQFGQNPGLVLDEGIAALKRLGLEVIVRKQSCNDVMRVAVQGGRWESLRAIGMTRPVRLLATSPLMWEGKDLSRKGPQAEVGSSWATILSVEYIGVRDVVAMQTGTETFIANGFATHNSTLKSYVGLRAIATTQAAGYTAALIDTEHAFDADWAKALGVSVDDLILQHPPDGETAMDTAELLLRSGLDLLVFDSVAATLPRAERETKLSGDKNVQPARLASLMSLALRKLTAANQGRTALLWINQTRMNIGVTYGSPETVPGGKALPFYASWRLSLRKAGRVTVDSSTFDGSKMKSIKQTNAVTIRAYTEKSKLDRPFRECYFNFCLNTASIDDIGFLVNLGMEKGKITRATGGVFSYGDLKVRGLESFKSQLDVAKLATELGIDVKAYRLDRPEIRKTSPTIIRKRKR